MSIDQDGFRWCDSCWDNTATYIALLHDGSRKDYCEGCVEEADSDAFIIKEGK